MGGFFYPPNSLRKWPFLVQKMIKPYSPIYVRTLYKVWNPWDPPQPPKKPTFWKYWKSYQKLGFFKKVGFWGSKGGFMISNLQKMIFYINIYWFFLFGTQKSPFFQKSVSENMPFLNLSGALGGPSEKNFCQKGFQTLNHNKMKKSLTFGPKKITLKLICGCFPLGGAKKAPPVSNRVK